MPTLRALQIPAPALPQEFEELCRDLHAACWKDPDAKLVGRSGQKQFGIDVLGQRDGEVTAVQCKLRKGKPSMKDFAEDIDEARQHWKDLRHLVLATTRRGTERCRRTWRRASSFTAEFSSLRRSSHFLMPWSSGRTPGDGSRWTVDDFVVGFQRRREGGAILRCPRSRAAARGAEEGRVNLGGSANPTRAGSSRTRSPQ